MLGCLYFIIENGRCKEIERFLYFWKNFNFILVVWMTPKQTHKDPSNPLLFAIWRDKSEEQLNIGYHFNIHRQYMMYNCQFLGGSVIETIASRKTHYNISLFFFFFYYLLEEESSTTINITIENWRSKQNTWRLLLVSFWSACDLQASRFFSWFIIALSRNHWKSRKSAKETFLFAKIRRADIKIKKINTL